MDVRLPLGNGVYAIIDEKDYPKVMFLTFYLMKGYACTHDGKLLHRLVMGAKPGQDVDHKDLDRLNCRKENLRFSSFEQNAQNRKIRPDNTTGYKGVRECPKTGRFVARITANGKRWYIGKYDTAEQAARAYDKWARELHGPFAQTNFPEDS